MSPTKDAEEQLVTIIEEATSALNHCLAGNYNLADHYTMSIGQRATRANLLVKSLGKTMCPVCKADLPQGEAVHKGLCEQYARYKESALKKGNTPALFHQYKEAFNFASLPNRVQLEQ